MFSNDEINALGVIRLYLDNPDPSNNCIWLDIFLLNLFWINWIPLSTEIVSFNLSEILATKLSEIRLSESFSTAEYISSTWLLFKVL